MAKKKDKKRRGPTGAVLIKRAANSIAAGAMAKARGRPPKQPDGIAPVLIERAMNALVVAAGDPRLGSQVGILLLQKKLSSTQAAAAFRAAGIYGRFERHHRIRRTAKAQAYEFGFGGAGLSEELMTPEQIDELRAQEAEAEKDFRDLQEELPVYVGRYVPIPRTDQPAMWIEQDKRKEFDVRRAKDAFERLCVQDQHVPWFELDQMVKPILDRLALYFGIVSSTKAKQADGRRPARKPGAGKRIDAEREAQFAVMRKLRPDLSDEDLELAFQAGRVLKDRAIANAKAGIVPEAVAAPAKAAIAPGSTRSTTLALSEEALTKLME